MRRAGTQRNDRVVPTGIRGFDSLTPGGIPKRKVTLLTGGSGVGKTVFATQMAVTNAAAGLPGVYVTFEESPAEILANIATFNWPSGPRVQRNLHLLEGDLGPDAIVSGSFDLCGLIASLEAEFRTRKAAWVVLDGLDQLLGLLADPIAERREIYRLKRWVAASGVACLVTAKEDVGGWAREVGQADGLMAFAADCVVRLSVSTSERVIHRALRIVKYRGSGGPGGEHPVVISERGILVGYVRSDAVVPASSVRVSTGIAQLDEHLQGGYRRGTSVLISGQPGTSKTTLAACLAASACARGERALMVLFDEGAEQVRAHLKSVSIDLDAHVNRGMLRMEALAAHSVSAEDHFVSIVSWIEEFRPAVLIVDPISALAKTSGDAMAGSVAERVMHVARQRGVTTLFTTLLSEADGPLNDNAVGVSTLADTWINLNYLVHSGERNRSLSIIKSRGTRHSNQVRELILDNAGLRLADVFIDGGAVLMGTARLEREQALRRDDAQRARDFARRVEEARAEEHRLLGQLADLQKALAAHRQQAAALSVAEDARASEELQRVEEIGHSRFVPENRLTQRIAGRRKRQAEARRGSLGDSARKKRG